MAIKRIRISGSGGQGILTAGLILAEAAALADGKHVVQSNSYGPESRGGASKTEVLISDEEIDYPKATHIDVLVALNQQSYDKYYMDMGKNGIVIVDSFLVKKYPSKSDQCIAVNITGLAEKQLGNRMVANVIALGVLVVKTQIVSEEAILSAIEARVPERFKELNIRAAKLGFKQGGK